MEHADTFELARPDGVTVNLNGAAAIESFTSSELEYWRWLGDTNNTPAQVRDKWRRLRDMLDRLRAAAGDLSSLPAETAASQPDEGQSIRAKICSHLDALATQKAWLPSDTPQSKMVERMRAESAVDAANTWLAFVAPKEADLRDDDALRGLMRAMLFELGIESDTVEAEKSALRGVQKNWRDSAERAHQKFQQFEREFGNLTNSIQDLHSDQSRSFGDLLDFGHNELNKVTAAYDEKMALQKPVAYWKAQEAFHRKRVGCYSVAFSFGLAAVVCAGWFVAKNLFPALLNPTDTTTVEVWRLGLFLVAMGLLLWPVRLLSRVLLSNIHLGVDAKERTTMTLTYIALIRSQDALKDGDRKLVLETLFRPAATGIVNEDGAGQWAHTIMSRVMSGEKGVK